MLDINTSYHDDLDVIEDVINSKADKITILINSVELQDADVPSAVGEGEKFRRNLTRIGVDRQSKTRGLSLKNCR